MPLTDTLSLAYDVLKRSYSPYSNYAVGAVITTDNDCYAGTNIENASYGVTICAESSAISAMIAAGKTKIDSITIVNKQKTLCPPCGACLQRISEFAHANTTVILHTEEKGEEILPFNKFLPLGFASDML